MADVLKFSIKDNAIWSSLPYALMWILSIASGFTADWMLEKQILSITNVRKLFTTIASLFPSIFLVAASYAGCRRTDVIIYFTLAMGLMGAVYPGIKVNMLDLSPNYAPVLMAITNGFGAITGMIAPFLVGFLTPDVCKNHYVESR